ncbi:ACT domain-containing protein ACR6-like isoform X1 [Iris pallida]|uniref:ACT domain-containing protein ACR n=1 Tax=Iris pallida TaxID=29817 RepID=A0AAX6IAW2_IRIPA|nr:ACT domain-containing protein ACR6-like isoform X1 [Iris pallida]
MGFLEVIQVLTDLNLIITKAYISSDGSWFMDVFNGQTAMEIKFGTKRSFIHTKCPRDRCLPPSLRKSSVGVMPSEEHTSIELTGTDRPGLLSEVCAVLTDLGCNVVKAEVWTHNARVAAVVHVTDGATGLAIEDPGRLATVRELLCNVLRADGDFRKAKSAVAMGVTHTQRRLHQLMFDDRDYERRGRRRRLDGGEEDVPAPRSDGDGLLGEGLHRGYTEVQGSTEASFDTICTLTDMQYVVFHGTVSTGSGEAYQEYYIRHVDGLPMSSQPERERVIQCLEAAIERRASEGLELELRTEDRVGLLSDITRIFREHGLCVRRAEISTSGGKAVDSFYVSEMSGGPVEASTIESVRRQIGQTVLRVKQNPSTQKPESNTGFLFANFFKGCSFQSFRLIRSYS